MKKTFLSKAGVALATVALASMTAVPAFAMTSNPATQTQNDGGSTTWSSAAGDAATSATHNMLVFVDANGDGNTTYDASDDRDAVTGTWSVVIPDQCALKAATSTTAGKPGTYTGTAEISYSGTIGTAQTLTVKSNDFKLTDAKGWSSDVSCTHTDSGLSALNNATVSKGGKGSTAFSATVGAGSWSGTCVYDITLANA